MHHLALAVRLHKRLVFAPYRQSGSPSCRRRGFSLASFIRSRGWCQRLRSLHSSRVAKISNARTGGWRGAGAVNASRGDGLAGFASLLKHLYLSPLYAPLLFASAPVAFPASPVQTPSTRHRALQLRCGFTWDRRVSAKSNQCSGRRFFLHVTARERTGGATRKQRAAKENGCCWRCATGTGLAGRAGRAAFSPSRRDATPPMLLSCYTFRLTSLSLTYRLLSPSDVQYTTLFTFSAGMCCTCARWVHSTMYSVRFSHLSAADAGCRADSGVGRAAKEEGRIALGEAGQRSDRALDCVPFWKNVGHGACAARVHRPRTQAPAYWRTLCMRCTLPTTPRHALYWQAISLFICSSCGVCGAGWNTGRTT